MLNIGSLALGTLSWFLAALAITASDVTIAHRNTTFSFGFCTVSLVLQLCEISRRVRLGDYAAVEDTIRAVLIASVVLVAVTFILNFIALARSKRK